LCKDGTDVVAKSQLISGIFHEKPIDVRSENEQDAKVPVSKYGTTTTKSVEDSTQLSAEEAEHFAEEVGVEAKTQDFEAQDFEKTQDFGDDINEHEETHQMKKENGAVGERKTTGVTAHSPACADPPTQSKNKNGKSGFVRDYLNPRFLCYAAVAFGVLVVLLMILRIGNGSAQPRVSGVVPFSAEETGNEYIPNFDALLQDIQDLIKSLSSFIIPTSDEKPEGDDEVSSLISHSDQLKVYREAGHAIVDTIVNGCDASKVTIVPRARNAGGLTFFESKVRLKPSDMYNPQSRSLLEAQLAVALGGRTAEEIVFGQQNDVNDVQQVSSIARRVVSGWGNGAPDYNQHSDKDIGTIDGEVDGIMRNAYNICRSILIPNRALLDDLARMLIEQETVSGHQLCDLVTSSGAKFDFDPVSHTHRTLCRGTTSWFGSVISYPLTFFGFSG